MSSTRHNRKIICLIVLQFLICSCSTFNFMSDNKVQDIEFLNTEIVVVDKVGLARDVLRKKRLIYFSNFDQELVSSVLKSKKKEMLKGLMKTEREKVGREAMKVERATAHRSSRRDRLCKNNNKYCTKVKLDKKQILDETAKIFNVIISKYNKSQHGEKFYRLDVEILRLSVYLKNIKGIEETVSNKIAEMTKMDQVRKFQGMILLGESSENSFLKKRISTMLESRIEGKDIEYNNSFKKKLHTIADRVNWQFYILNNYCFQERKKSKSCQFVGNLFAGLKFDYSYLKFQVENLLKTQVSGMKIAAKRFIEVRKGSKFLKKLLLKRELEKGKI